MRILTTFLITLLILACQTPQANQQTQTSTMATVDTEKSFYDFTLKSLIGDKDIPLSNFKGKKVLVVNVASKCGYTPQYEQLQALHEEHGEQITILGFPANNFGSQEPGTHEEIASFCKLNYGVTFQMFEKISVKGSDQHPLYQWLTAQSGQEPSWNFCKYLIDEEGKVVKFFASGADPMGDEILNMIKG